jgi:tetratricopeptide (TPR) repeat protein
MKMRPLVLGLLVALPAAPALAQKGRIAHPPAAAQARPPVTAAELTERAREALQAGDATQALALAQEARRSAPSDYKPPYYVGLALLSLGDFDAARKEQEESLSLAQSDEQKKAVQDLGVAIQAQQGVLDADQAAKDGLYNKAATLYFRAYSKGGNAQAGLKAAQLYEQKLSDVIRAFYTLDGVRERFPGSAAGASAASEIARLHPELVRLSAFKVRQAAEVEPKYKKMILEQAIEFDAENDDARFAMLNVLTAPAAWPQAEKQLKALQIKGRLEEGFRQGKIDAAGFDSNEKFKQFLHDAWGPAKTESILKAAAAVKKRPE